MEIKTYSIDPTSRVVPPLEMKNDMNKGSHKPKEAKQSISENIALDLMKQYKK